MFPPPLQAKGIDAYKKTWDLFFSWAHDFGVFDIDEMTITAGDDVPFVTGRDALCWRRGEPG